MLLFTDSFAIVGLCYIKFGRLRTFFKVEFKTDINYSYSHKQLSVIIIVSRKVFRYICKKMIDIFKNTWSTEFTDCIKFSKTSTGCRTSGKNVRMQMHGKLHTTKCRWKEVNFHVLLQIKSPFFMKWIYLKQPQYLVFLLMVACLSFTL